MEAFGQSSLLDCQWGQIYEEVETKRTTLVEGETMDVNFETFMSNIMNI